MKKLILSLVLTFVAGAVYADVAPMDDEFIIQNAFDPVVDPSADELAKQHRFNDVAFTELVPFAEQGGQGVSGAFAGMTPEGLLIAGGCNFPYSPAAENGKKEFYTGIWLNAAPTTDGTWQQIGSLPCPLAYGQSVTVPEGIVCLGGTADGSKSEDFAVLFSVKGGQLQTKELPVLPLALDNFGAAFGDGYVWVAGGQHNGTLNLKAYRLKWPEAAAWEELPDMPSPGRVQPAAVVQRASIGPNFYLLGGYNSRYGKTLANSVYYDPRQKQWKATSMMQPQGEDMPVAFSGGTALASGAAHILCFGGVNRDVFDRALQRGLAIADEETDEEMREVLIDLQRQYMLQPTEWYNFADEILVYHTVTDTWIRVFQSPLLARAGATIVPVASTSGTTKCYIVGGELKPGIRSKAITGVEMTYTAHFGWLNWIVLIAYLLGMVYLGYYFMRRAGKSTDDFFKGGGRIPWWAAGISIFATMLSAITYMSIPAKAYATDWTYYPMQICILLVSFPVIKYYLPFFRRLNVTTAYEYLERRFNSVTRLMASILFIVFMVARTALVLFLPSLAMTAVTGINIYICIALMALITILYCTMGGVEAVVWGDVIQGIILVGGAVLAAVYLIVNTGDNGASDFFQIATDNDKFRLFLFDPDHPFDFVNATWWVVILGGLANNLISYTSDQTVIQRYLTTSDEKSAARGILTNGLMSVVVTIAFFTIGTGLYTFFKTHPAELDLTMAKGDAIFPFFMMSQLPAGLAGLLIAAVFAATMSTIASNINSISTAFTVDLWSKMKKKPTMPEASAASPSKNSMAAVPEASSATPSKNVKAAVPEASASGNAVRTARIAGICAGLIGMAIAWLMATVDIQSLLDYFNTILGLLSGAIGGLFIMGIFFPRIGSGAAMIGFLCGTATVLYMNFCTPANFLLFGFVSMLVSVVVALIISIFTPQTNTQPGLTWKTLPKE